MKKLSTPLLPSALRWSAAAAAGLTLMGCPDQEAADKGAKPGDEPASAVAANPTEEEGAKDKECCHGKNECKGKGGCAVPENNDCAGKNECKGQGGCNMHCPQ